MQQKSFIRLLPALLAAMAIMATSLFAQLSTSKVEGTVRDKDTGQPLQGAQVTIEGTRLGNVTNADGYYFVLNVPPGRRDITFTYTGYQKTTMANQLLLAGQTATVDAALSSTVVQLEGITIEAEAEPLVPRDQTTTKRRITSETIAETPATQLEDMMILEAGVQTGGQDALGRGMRIRGGRVGEEAMVVDGIMVRNYTANPQHHGQGWIHETELGSQGEDTTPLEFSTGTVEEVDILTGGFQAEFGNAQSGIVNIVTREGGPQIKGNVRFTSDQINPRTSDFGYNQLRANIGGPMGIPNMYFHVSGEIQGIADRFATHADEGFRGVNQDFVDRLNEGVRNDPYLGNLEEAPFSLEKFQTGREFYASRTDNNQSLFSPGNPVRLPNNWRDRTLGSGKLTYSPIQGVKILATNSYSRVQQCNPPGWNAQGNYFMTGVFERDNIHFANRTWGANEESVHVPQGYGRRTTTGTTTLGLNWDITQSAEQSLSAQVRYMSMMNRDINQSSIETNWERSTFMSWSPHDLRFEVEVWPHREGVSYDKDLRRQYLPDGETGWKKYVPYETPFLEALYTAYYLNYRYLREDQDNLKVDLDWQLNRQNRAKIGFQYMSDSNFMYRTHYSSVARDQWNEFRYEPKLYGVYAQNRTDLGDFVFDYGMRYDGFDPNGNWGITSLDAVGETVHPRYIYSWSPRFDVAFPVTDKSQLRFSYGVFTQLPSFQYIFSRSGGYGSRNDGYLEYSRTDAFEVGFSYLLSQDVVLDLVGFYRDVDGNVAQKTYFRDLYRWNTDRRSREWRSSTYVNRDNGNIKGLDLTLRKRFSNNFSLNMMYTLQFSRTTGSYPGSPGFSNLDPATGETYVAPDELAPIDGDRTHKITTQLNYLFPEDFMTGSTAGTILKNVRAWATFRIMSGQPVLSRGGSNYSQSSGTGYSMGSGGVNFFRDRWYVNLDLRLTKSFSLGKARRISVFGEILNVLNRKNKRRYPSGYSYASYLRSPPTGGVDWAWEGRSDREKVRFNADFNGDGILTVEESILGAISQNFMDATMDKRMWGSARQIRSGVGFSW